MLRGYVAITGTLIMIINVRKDNDIWIAEVWSEMSSDTRTGFNEPYPEEQYTEINSWCKDILGYAARTAYHIFEFKKQQDMEWFLLRWN